MPLNAKLEKMYENWIGQLDSSFFNNDFSNPYLVYAPNNWSKSQIRIMIIGKEGYGNWGAGAKDPSYNPNTSGGIQKLMGYNGDYVIAQTQKRCLYKGYKYNRSSFWRRFRNIYDISKNSSMIWNNIDKIHYCKASGCSLIDKDRGLLHNTTIKVLDEEIKILQPTHIMFFGWYTESLRAELPNLQALFIKQLASWRSIHIVKVNYNGIKVIFSNHPSWRGKYKPTSYEQDVIKTIP